MLEQIGQFFEECATPGYPIKVLMVNSCTGDEAIFTVLAEEDTFVGFIKALDELRAFMGSKLAGYEIKESW